MESLIRKLFIHQWQRKLVALSIATLVWVFVNYSITETKTIPLVPIRVIGLPADKTIQGLLPNGFLTKRTTLTLSGTKDVINQLEPGDLEVILDVSSMSNEGIVQISKKNLVSFNPNFNVLKHITSVTYPEFVLKMSPLLTEKIPLVIHTPDGTPPEGYEFLDIWPKNLIQTVSGPQEDVLNLKNKGLELTFNLDDITKEQLDAIKSKGSFDDEIAFPVPDQWKKVNVPFSTRGTMSINDPEAKNLQINFLRQQLIPIKNDLPLHIFYPLKNSATINPETYPLAPSTLIQMNHDIPVLKLPLFASHVSNLFLEIVKDNIELEVVTAPPNEREELEWDVGFIDDQHLEGTYVAYLLTNLKNSNSEIPFLKNRELENLFRKRFRTYMQRFTLYLTPDHPLEMDCRLEEGRVRIHVPHTSLITHPKTTHAD